jgi:LysM repeat protein
MWRWISLFVILAVLLTQVGGPRLTNAQQEAPELTILLEDEFDAPGLWAEAAGENYSMRYIEGTYEMRNDQPSSYINSVRPGNLVNVLIETQAVLLEESAGASYGVACRWQDPHNYYAMLVLEDGRAVIVRLFNNTLTELAQATVAIDSIVPNRIGALCVGNTLNLLFNGEVVLQANDTAFSSGMAGMVVGAGDLVGAVVRYDWLLLAAVNETLTFTPVEFFPGIGPGEQLYIVRHEDTLDEIAARFQVTLAALMQRNPHILNPALVFGGQRLTIPAGAVAPVEQEDEALIPQTGIQAPLFHPPDLHPNVSVPILHGEFGNENAWLTSADAELQLEYEDGVLRVTNDRADHHATRVRPFDLPLVHVEVDARHAAGDQGQWGVVCRWQDAQNYYAFALGFDGTPMIIKMQNGTATVMAEGELQYDTGEWNQIGANCYGPALTLYLNGTAVLQTIDPAFSSGYIGIFVQNQTEPSMEVHFTNLTAYVPESVVIDLNN